MLARVVSASQGHAAWWELWSVFAVMNVAAATAMGAMDLVGADAEVAFEDVRRAAHGARLAERPLGRVGHRPCPPWFHQSVEFPVRHSSRSSSATVSAGLPT
jgi:hypothetical protein